MNEHDRGDVSPDEPGADLGPRLGDLMGRAVADVDGAGVTRAGIAARADGQRRATRQRRLLLGAAAALLLVGGGVAVAASRGDDGSAQVAAGPDRTSTTVGSTTTSTVVLCGSMSGYTPTFGASEQPSTCGTGAAPPPPTTTSTAPEATTTEAPTTTSTTAVPETTTTSTPIPAKPEEVASFAEGGTAFAVYVTSFLLGEDYMDSVDVWEDPGQGYQLQAYGYAGRSNPMACDQGSESVFPPFTPDPRNHAWVVGAYFASLAEAESFAANDPHPTYGPVEVRTTCIAQPDPATDWTRRQQDLGR